MVLTILEGLIQPEKWESLREKYRGIAANIPRQMVSTTLLQNRNEPTHWKVISIWRSQEELAEYRKSVEVPEGIRLFKAFGVEPILSVYDVREFK